MSIKDIVLDADVFAVGGVLYCQRGFSAAISRQGRLFMGAPSCKNDSGSVGRVYVDNSNAGDASSTAFESGEPLYFSHAVAAGLPSPGRAPRLASSVVTYRGTSVGGKVRRHQSSASTRIVEEARIGLERLDQVRLRR